MTKPIEPAFFNLSKVIGKLEKISESQINMRGIISMLNENVLSVKEKGPLYQDVQNFVYEQQKAESSGAQLNFNGAMGSLNKILSRYFP